MLTCRDLQACLNLKRLGLSLTLLLGLIFAGCSAPTPPIEQTFYAFGTEVQVLIIDQDPTKAQQAIQQVEQAFHQFHRQWHAWEPGGTLYQINQAIAQDQPIKVSAETQAFIEKTQALSAKTDYIFDPAIGQLIRLWGFQGQQEVSPPSDADRQTWLSSRPSIRDLYFENHHLLSRNPDVQLDFGGNAKGLALDIAEDILLEQGIQTALINIGGDSKVIGHKPNNQAWLFGIQNPKNPQQAIARVEVYANENIFTSGTYQRYFDWQGQRYSHIINPNTAWPADSLASVTVIDEDAIKADTAATALLIAGPQNWQVLAARLGVTRVLTIDQQGQIAMTAAMQERVKP